MRILDSALVAAAVNSHKYMSERRLPDKPQGPPDRGGEAQRMPGYMILKNATSEPCVEESDTHMCQHSHPPTTEL